MGYKIPTYETFKQLDSGAHTIPRYTANDHMSNALKSVGSSIGSLQAVADRQRKQAEAHENFMVAQDYAQYQDNLKGHIAEITAGWSHGEPGYHQAAMPGVNDAGRAFMTRVPARLRDQYAKRVETNDNHYSNTTAQYELQDRNKFYMDTATKVVSTLAVELENHPDAKTIPTMFKDQMKQAADTLDSAVTLNALQKRDAMQIFTKMLMTAGQKNYVSKGQYDQGNEWLKSIRPQGLEQDNAQPQQTTPAAGGRTSGLDARRIAAIDAGPHRQIIEEEAAKAGIHPDLGKVVVHIESSGNARANEGKGTQYKGLTQINQAGLGMYGGGDIYDPRDNARAGFRSMAADAKSFALKYGREATPAETYFMHQQGRDGAGNHLANPDEAAWKNMWATGEGQQKGPEWAKKAIWGNVPTDLKARFGNVENVTGRDMAAMWEAKVTGTPFDQAKQQVASRGPLRPGGPPAKDQPAETLVADSSGKIVGGAPIDPNKPQIQNKDGSFSTERSITVNLDGKFVNIPSIVNGKQLTPAQAIIAHQRGQNPALGTFGTQEEAVAAAEARSKQIGATVPQQGDGAQPVAAKAPTYTPLGSFVDQLIAKTTGAKVKSVAADKAATRDLTAAIKNDIASIKSTGKEIDINPEEVQNRLGEGPLNDWQAERALAHNFAAQMADIDKLPRDEVFERLNGLLPVPGSRDFIAASANYTEASRAVTGLMNDRAKDPAMAVSADPGVMEAAKAAQGGDPAAASKLGEARMAAQERIGIAEEYRSPITVPEAQAYARRLSDPLIQNKPDFARQMVDHIRQVFGDKYSKQAMGTILRQTGIDKDTSETIADSFNKAARGPTVNQPQTPAKDPYATGENRGAQALNTSRGIMDVEGFYPPAATDNPNPLTDAQMFASGQAPKDAFGDRIFKPGEGGMINTEDAAALLKEPGRAQEFNKHYGAGAAEWALSRGAGNSYLPGDPAPLDLGPAPKFNGNDPIPSQADMPAPQPDAADPYADNSPDYNYGVE